MWATLDNQDAAELLETIIDSQAGLPCFRRLNVSAPSDLVPSSERWSTVRSGNRVERHLRPDNNDPSFEPRMARIVGFPLARMTEERAGVWSEAFIDGSPLNGSIEPWAAAMKSHLALYERLPVQIKDVVFGAEMIAQLANVSTLSAQSVNSRGIHSNHLVNLLMGNPAWRHGDVHAGNVHLSSTGELWLLDHEWMAVTGAEWAAIPMLAGFAATPWPVRWKLAEGCSPKLLLVAYAVRFPSTLDDESPMSSKLRDAVKDLLSGDLP